MQEYNHRSDSVSASGTASASSFGFVNGSMNGSAMSSGGPLKDESAHISSCRGRAGSNSKASSLSASASASASLAASIGTGPTLDLSTSGGVSVSGYKDIESAITSTFEGVSVRQQKQQQPAKIRVLIVDDSDINRKFLAKILSRCKTHTFEIVEANDGTSIYIYIYILYYILY